MTTSRLEERSKAEAAAAEWWQYQPFPLAREGVPYVCGVCGAAIAAREGTSLVGTLLMCPSCTDRTYGTVPTQPGAGPPIGPPSEQLPYRPVVPEAIRADAPWAAPDYPPPMVQQPPVPPLMQTAPPPPPIAAPAHGVTRPAGGRRPIWLWMGLGITSALALLVALLVWSPWSAAGPPRPTGVLVTSTAGTATITWAASEGGTPVTQYLILRDGEQIGTVSGATTTYVDRSLVPGTSYTYTVVAQVGDKRSGPSAAVATTTATPSPMNVRVTNRAVTTLTLRWAAPADSPTPDRYVILRNGEQIGTVAGSATTFRATGLVPATRYTYRVIAYWGENFSAPSAQAAGTTVKPSLGAARLGGSLPLRIKVTATGGGTLAKGKTWTDTWRFAPACSSGACNTVLHGDITPPGNTTHTFTVRLVRHGAVYTGSTSAHITHCGMTPLTTNVRSTLQVTVRVLSGHIVNGNWVADRWTGTLRMLSPYTSAGLYYCPAQTVVMTLTGR